MSFSSNLTATALRLLTQYGQAFSATRNSGASYVVSTGNTSAGTSSTYSGYCYPEQYNSIFIDGEVIKQQDIRLTLSSTTTPLIGDVLTIDEIAYTALNVEKITAQGSNIIYIVQLRQ